MSTYETELGSFPNAGSHRGIWADQLLKQVASRELEKDPEVLFFERLHEGIDEVVDPSKLAAVLAKREDPTKPNILSRSKPKPSLLPSAD